MWFNSFPQDGGDICEIEENGRPVPSKGRNYILTKELIAAIDVAIGLGRPLLVSGEPGCGKTELGYAIACPGRDTMRASAAYRLTPDGFRGRVAMIMGAKNMTMTEVQAGRRLGTCADLAGR